MSAIAVEGLPVTKKKAKSQPKRYGTLIRVTDEGAEAIRRAASFENLSIAEFVTRYVIPLAEKRYREGVVKEARRVEGKD